MRTARELLDEVALTVGVVKETDSYDLQHSETGSSNISGATPEWQMMLRLAREGHGVGEYVLHRAYSLVNRQVKAGVPWSKCQSCGSPYKIGSRGLNSHTHCSRECFNDAVADLDWNR